MTTSDGSPNSPYDPNNHHYATTVARPQLRFAPPVGPLSPAAASTPTWKGGWIVSGLAAVLSVAALGVAGGLALDALAQSHPAPEAVSVSAPAPAPAPAPAALAPVLIAPVVTVSPGLPGPARTTGTLRVAEVPSPTTAPAAPSRPMVPADGPIVAPPEPVTPPAPPIGIGTCDLVACEPIPPQPAK